jgi:beta-glucosidase
MYPFGYGLSYTQFKYSGLTIPNKIAHRGDTLQVAVDVQNTGSMAGDEVVQVYTGYPASAIVRPAKQLVAFQRVSLNAGETKHVVLQVPTPNLAYWDSPSASFVVAPGFYPLQVGSSSADIRLNGTYMLQ